MPRKNPHNMLYQSGCTYVLSLKQRSCCSGFYDEACYRFFLLRLTNCLRYFKIDLHAYVLLPEEVLLLVTAGSSSGISGIIAEVASSYSDYFNNRFARRAAKWSSNMKCIAVAEDGLALTCQKYIEREPLQRTLVQHPGNWPWSSYGANGFGGHCKYLTRHRAFAGYLRQPGRSLESYREFVATAFQQPHFHYLRNKIERGLALQAPREVRPRVIRGARTSVVRRGQANSQL